MTSSDATAKLSRLKRFYRELLRLKPGQTLFHGTTSNDDDIERALRENLGLRRQLMSEVIKAVEPVTFK